MLDSSFKFDVEVKEDIDKILDIYNSNRSFLENHLGVSAVTKEFILNEMKEMKKSGFQSFVIKDNADRIIGICDIKISEESYLSLFMINGKMKRSGLGSDIYNQMEEFLKAEGVKRIRIDVVYDYEDNVVGFWEKNGFMHYEKIQLEWNGYKSKAIRMCKSI